MTDDNTPRRPWTDASEEAEVRRALAALDRELHRIAAHRSERVPLPGSVAAQPAEPMPGRRWHIGRKGRLVMTGLAAASVAGLAIVSQRPAFPPAETVPFAASALDVRTTRPFVVFQTGNPDLAIVWLLNDSETEE